jgi:hypothetical protein
LQGVDALRVRQLDQLHAGEADHYDTRHAGAQRRASVVGTASYRHTLMRCAPARSAAGRRRHVRPPALRVVARSVRTMNEDALARRIKAIERAKGKHAVIKMRLFARVLFLEARAAWLPCQESSRELTPVVTAFLVRSFAGV